MNKSHRIFTSSTCLLLILALLISGYGCNIFQSSSPDVYEFVFSDHNPEQVPTCLAHVQAGEWLEEYTHGRIKFTNYTGASLLGEAEALRGVEIGIADLALYVLNNQQGFKLNTVIQLPFMGWPGRVETGEIYTQLLADTPELQAEWPVHVLGIIMMPPTGIHTTKKPVESLSDLKGMNIATTGEMSQLISYLGANPVEIEITEQYSSLERGLIDGTHNHFSVLKAFNMFDVINFHTMFGEGGINMSPAMLVMNKDKYDALPADLQAIIDNEFAKKYQELFYGMEDAWYEDAVRLSNEAGNTFIYLTDEQIDEFRDAALPVHEAWINLMGPGAQSVYDKALELASSYK